MDGLNFKCVSTLMQTEFERDSFGSFIPNPNKLRMSVAQERLRRQLNADTGFYQRLAAIYERTDVQFTDNPLGNTPTLGVGYKLFGKRPLNVKRGSKLDRIRGEGQKLDKQLKNRQHKIEAIHNELANVYESLKPTIDSKAKQLLYDVEGDQLMTGGGFDNNAIGEVNKSALNFVIDSSTDIDYRDTVLSQYVVDGCLWVRDLIKDSGMAFGSIKPQGASVVRAAQDNDGMFGYPVFASGYDEWTQDLATRLLIETGVVTEHLVGSTVFDKVKGTSRKFAVIDAAGYILDNKIFTADDMVSLVTLLARIQKHGWKMENGELQAKPGKTRSVYPNAFIPAVIESMIIAPFNDQLKAIKCKILPSLQDKKTRLDIIKKQIIDAIDNGFDYLAADWSKYDATVRGSILATMMQLVVKPFIHKDYHYWIDAATYILTYKYLVCSQPLCELNADMYQKARQIVPNFDIKGYTIFGLVNGLISGAKFTHVGGSLYGEVVIHYCIGRILGWDPIPGAQAGDDTLMGVPLDRIHPDSVTATYEPIIDAASKYGLRANASKQIWHQQDGEVVKVFLQDSYHKACDIWGVGSIFRPADAVWVSEREKGLSVAEQLMAEISRMNQGADSPFVHAVVEWWLSHERYLGWIFKEYGVSGFNKLIETIGLSLEEIAQSIDVGSFSFSVSKADLEAGTLDILPVMAEVAASMTFSSEDRADFLKDLEPQDKGMTFVDNLELDDDDSIE